MTDINHVVLIGRLTRDIGSDEHSFAYLQNGQARANVSIAVNYSTKQGEQWVEAANFFDVTIWGKTAENLKPYLLKGQQVAIDGHLKQDRWEKDGQKYSKVSVVADSVQLFGGKNNNQQPPIQTNQNQPAQQPQQQTQYQQRPAQPQTQQQYQQPQQQRPQGQNNGYLPYQSQQNDGGFQQYSDIPF